MTSATVVDAKILINWRKKLIISKVKYKTQSCAKFLANKISEIGTLQAIFCSQIKFAIPKCEKWKF